jgi:hypothetical protein
MVFVRPWNGFAGNGASDALMDRRTLFARMVARLSRPMVCSSRTASGIGAI